MELLRHLFTAPAKKAPRFAKESVNQEVLNARCVRWDMGCGEWSWLGFCVMDGVG